MKKYGRWGLILFAAFYLLSNPEGAARSVNGALDGLNSAGNSLSRFVNELGE